MRYNKTDEIYRQGQLDLITDLREFITGLLKVHEICYKEDGDECGYVNAMEDVTAFMDVRKRRLMHQPLQETPKE